MPDRFSVDQNHRFWDSLDETGQELIAAAIALVRAFELPLRVLPEALAVLVRDWNPDWT